MHRTALFCLRNLSRSGVFGQPQRCANGMAQTVLREAEEPSCSGDIGAKGKLEGQKEAPVVFVLNEADITRLNDLKLWRQSVPAAEKLSGNTKPIEEVWVEQSSVPLNKRLVYYSRLAKSRLSGMVVLTAMAGYAMSPDAFILSQFASCCVGTALLSSSANSINQFLEMPFDAQMKRTQNRVLVRGYLTPLHAVGFGLTAAATGVGILYFGNNGLTALLGLANCLLYTSVYTPMKRISIANTWLGSVVGAIPPLMGWAACSGTLHPGAFVTAGLLFAWQFPHFNALSWNLRPDYSRAGYRMMSVVRPDLCCKTSLRYSAVATAICSLAAPLTEVTTWTFAITSLPVNAALLYLSWQFYQKPDSKTSRRLFRYSLVYLPVVMLLLLCSRKEKPTVATDQHTSTGQSAQQL